MIYCIDSSSLIGAHVRSYPQSMFPKVWENLAKLADEGRLISSDAVLDELRRKEGDAVWRWAEARKTIFKPLTAAVQQHTSAVMAQFPKLVDERTGKSFADPFVIATAKVHACTVVTDETATGKADRPKIPDVCMALGIPCIRLLEVIRREGWMFG